MTKQAREFPSIINCFLSKTYMWTNLLKLINYSCSQKPINDLHFGQVDESWYPMKHQMKHHQVFIWDETCFSSEIKHLHFNEIFIDYTTHGNNAIYHCLIWENMSLHNFLLFHLRRHVKNSGFVLHHGFQTPRNRWKHEAADLVLSSVSRCLEPRWSTRPRFWHITRKAGL